LAAKPEPLIVIEVPAAPLGLFEDIVGSVVNPITGTVAAAVVEPLAPTECEPPADVGTVKVILQLPVALALVAEPTVVSLKVTTIPVSLAAKPVPVTVTAVPIVPLALLIEMLELTVKGIVVTEEIAVVGP
jgi:hypothetical protein